MANVQVAGFEALLHVALDNMPGALVYTDEHLNIVFCNDQFRNMYSGTCRAAPAGQSLPCFPPLPCRQRLLRRWGSRRSCCVNAWRASATPRARVSRIAPPTVAGIASCAVASASGGTVTVMTDVTEQKQAEQDLAAKEAQLLVALDNMPGALVYTDDRLNIVFCNDRFREIYGAPARIASAGPAIPMISSVTWQRMATTVMAMSKRSLTSASRAFAIHPTGASKTAHQMAAGCAFAAAGPKAAEPSRS